MHIFPALKRGANNRCASGAADGYYAGGYHMRMFPALKRGG